jgi:hypothetical protein
MRDKLTAMTLAVVDESCLFRVSGSDWLSPIFGILRRRERLHRILATLERQAANDRNGLTAEPFLGDPPTCYPLPERIPS